MKSSLNLYFDENSSIHSKTRFNELTEMSHERKHLYYYVAILIVKS